MVILTIPADTETSSEITNLGRTSCQDIPTPGPTRVRGGQTDPYQTILFFKEGGSARGQGTETFLFESVAIARAGRAPRRIRVDKQSDKFRKPLPRSSASGTMISETVGLRTTWRRRAGIHGKTKVWARPKGTHRRTSWADKTHALPINTATSGDQPRRRNTAGKRRA